MGRSQRPLIRVLRAAAVLATVTSAFVGGVAGHAEQVQPAPPAAASRPWHDVPAGASRPMMPDRSLEPPAGVVPSLTLYAQGVQRYICKPKEPKEKGGAAGEFEWVLKEPDAKLFDADYHEVGHHFAGPTWQLADGSQAVKKKVIATFPALQSDGVPWLLVELEGSGRGRLSNAKYVQRIDTVGGAAPHTGCDGTHAGATQDVEYRATYVFYAPAAK